MEPTFYSDGLNWERSGYFTHPIPKDDPQVLQDPERDLWLRWESILSRAKQGDFTEIPELLSLYNDAKDWVLRNICSHLLGDAGPAACFQLVIRDLQTSSNSVKKIEFCNALTCYGSLSVVPVIVETFASIRSFNDSSIIPVYLSDLLEEEAGPISDFSDSGSIEEYRSLVMDRYNTLKQRFGTDQILIFQGELFGVIRLSKILLRSFGEGTYDSNLRRKFEASTGINCSAFYKDGELQPLTAAVIVQEFLEGPEAHKYENGVRYFFGHRIPD